MHLRTIARRLLAATTMFLAVAAAPAFGQADLGVALTLAGESTDRGRGFTLDGGETYEAKVTNSGPTHVTSFVLDATIDAALTVGTVGGCVPVTTGTKFPCVYTPAAPLIQGGSETITIGVTYPAPDPLNPGTATCPNDAVDVTSSATVSGGMQGTTPVTDPTAGNNTSSTSNKLRDWADLEVVSATGPANASEGETIQYVVTVRNNGPCGANDVFVDFIAPLTLNLVSVTGICVNGGSGGGTFGINDDAGCDLGIDLNNATRWAASTTGSFTATYTVGTFPSDIIHAGIPVDVAISSISATSAVTATDDPDGSNNATSLLAQVDLSDNKGCSTGGAGTLLGLLSLVALRLGRRRAS